MTYFLRDILRQPEELRRSLAYLCGAGEPQLRAAAAAIRGGRRVYLTGIGSSWHAALGAAPLFHQRGYPVYLLDAGEMLQFANLAQDAVVIAISRSGRSVEIVSLLAQARNSGATVIGITSAADGPLAAEAQIAIVVPTKPDHAISVNTYSTLATAAAALAQRVAGAFDSDVAASLADSIAGAGQAISCWQEQVANSTWLGPGKPTYFLARGSGLASCHEARLLWEEGAKAPATAMGTGSFRHGPQEIVTKSVRVGMWLDGRELREQDLSVARDLRRLGASVMLIGQGVPAEAADLIFEMPKISPQFQFLLDIIPAQLAAERLAWLSGVDCDSFRACSYIVETEYGLIDDEVSAPGSATTP